MESGEPKLEASVTVCNEEEHGKEAVHSIFCFHEKIPDNSQVKVILPPGYRFVPKDVELVVHYLAKKIMKEPTPSYDQIKRVNVYKHNPQELSEIYPDFGDEEWYFFTPRDRKYLNGSRPNRAAGNGYWKATGADKPIRYNGEAIGWKKSLVFYQGKPPRGDKTDWIMHEYMVRQPPRMRTNANDMKLDDWVLCKIYKKAHRFTKNGKQSVPGTSRSVEEQMVFQDTEPVTEIQQETYAALIDQNEVEDNFFDDSTDMNVLINGLPYHDVPHCNSSLNINHHLLPQRAIFGFENSMNVGLARHIGDDLSNSRDYNIGNFQ